MAALGGLFKAIELPLIPNTPAVTERWLSEMEQIADILRLIISYCCFYKSMNFFTYCLTINLLIINLVFGTIVNLIVLNLFFQLFQWFS